jgi:hypothetical protein
MDSTLPAVGASAIVAAVAMSRGWVREGYGVRIRDRRPANPAPTSRAFHSAAYEMPNGPVAAG